MLNSLLNIGKTSLQASQAWINVTGNNIANADTDGYSRQYIDQRDSYAINYRPGEMGMGVNAQQVLRYYDSFLEQSYIRQNTNSARWGEQDKMMTSLETLFNESNRTGLSSTLNDYFKAWSDLGLYPDSTAHRESLVSYADNLSDMFSNTAEQHCICSSRIAASNDHYGFALVTHPVTGCAISHAATSQGCFICKAEFSGICPCGQHNRPAVKCTFAGFQHLRRRGKIHVLNLGILALSAKALCLLLHLFRQGKSVYPLFKAWIVIDFFCQSHLATGRQFFQH